MITRFVANTPIDALWVSGRWKFAEAGWLMAVDQRKSLTAYNADVDDFACSR
jgi:hypothetical protein